MFKPLGVIERISETEWKHSFYRPPILQKRYAGAYWQEQTWFEYHTAIVCMFSKNIRLLEI